MIPNFEIASCQVAIGMGNLAIAMRQASQADLTLLPYALLSCLTRPEMWAYQVVLEVNVRHCLLNGRFSC
jgi:hypothetical protein